MAHLSVGALVGLRIILVANVLVLAIVGLLCLLYYERPEAYLFAGAAWAVDSVLVFLVRLTDPYRPRRVRHR